MSDTSQGIHFQEFPELEDFPHFTLEVVSPELPCGSGWLGNCFLELGIALWKPWSLDTSKKWERLAPFHYRYVQGPSPLQQTLPALVTGREFIFRPHPVPRFSHQCPLICPDQKKVVFLVRDPRDALYSEWRRQQANCRIPQSMSFIDFVGSRCYHYPFSFRNYLLLFLRLWRSVLAEKEHLIVRFEDYKTNANVTLQRVIDFLGIKVKGSDIERATKASDFSVAKKIEQQRLAKNELQLELNRAGIPFEYVDSYKPTMHDSIGPLFDPLYQWLGYESHDEARRRSYPSQLSEFEVDRLLAAMDASRGPETQRKRLAGLLQLHAADIILYGWEPIDLRQSQASTDSATGTVPHLDERDVRIANLKAALNRIYDSHGWKALLIYYKVRDKIFPVDSKRRKVAKIVWNYFVNLVLR